MTEHTEFGLPYHKAGVVKSTHKAPGGPVMAVLDRLRKRKVEQPLCIPETFLRPPHSGHYSGMDNVMLLDNKTHPYLGVNSKAFNELFGVDFFKPTASVDGCTDTLPKYTEEEYRKSIMDTKHFLGSMNMQNMLYILYPELHKPIVPKGV